MSLMVAWHTAGGKTRTNSLPLSHLSSVSALVGLSKNLLTTAYPDTSQQPLHLASEEHLTFTPDEECLSLPADVTRTTLRLIVKHDGWEYVVHERDLEATGGDGASARDADDTLMVAVVEFESMAMIIGNFGIRLRLVAYPVISVKKTFLRDIEERLRTDPNFKGILS